MAPKLTTATVLPYGTTKQPLSSLLGPGEGWFNVMSFGANRDGTDDILAIEAAIEAAEDAGGGIVWLPPGNSGSEYYQVSRSISNLTNRGVGLCITLMGVRGDDPSNGSWIKGQFGGDTMNILGAAASAEPGWAGAIELEVADTSNLVTEYSSSESGGPVGVRIVVSGATGSGGFTAAVNGRWSFVVVDSTHLLLQYSTMVGAWTSGGIVTSIAYVIDCPDFGNLIGYGHTTLFAMDGVSLSNSHAAGGALRLNWKTLASIRNGVFSGSAVGVNMGSNLFCSSFENNTVSCSDPYSQGSIGILVSQVAIKGCNFSVFETNILMHGTGGALTSSRFEGAWTGLRIGTNFHQRNQAQGVLISANSTEQIDTAVYIDAASALNFTGNVLTSDVSPRSIILTAYIDDNSTPGTYSGVAGNKLTVVNIISNYSNSTINPLGTSHEINDVALGGTAYGTQITGQLSGTTGGVGVYTVSGANQAVPSAQMTWGRPQYGIRFMGAINTSLFAANTVSVDAEQGTHDFSLAEGQYSTVMGHGGGAPTDFTYPNNKAGWEFINCTFQYEVPFINLPGESSGPAGMLPTHGMKRNVSDGALFGGGTATMGARIQGSGTQHLEARYNATAGLEYWTCSAL